MTTTSLKSIIAEVQDVEPFVLTLSNSKRVTFPDIFGMESGEAERLFKEMEAGQAGIWQQLENWLSAEDAAKLRAEKLTLRQLMAVVERVRAYYEGHYGDMGEGKDLPA